MVTIMHIFAAKVATKAALLAKGAMFGAATGAVAAVVDEHTHIPIGVAVSVGIFACTVVLWVGVRIQRLSDSFEALGTAISDLHKRLDALPCNHPDCPTNKKQ